MIKGIHHIGASVQELDEVVAFYTAAAALQNAGGFTTVDNPAADRVTGLKNIDSRTIFLGANTTYLELFQYESPTPPAQVIMPVKGPGITHVCFQSPETNPAFERFKQQGMKMVSRGDKPVRLSAERGITYAYGRDPAGIMLETEQWEIPPRPFPLWIAHVAFVSPDIERLTAFYSRTLLQQESVPNIIDIKEREPFDIVANYDNVALRGTWIPTPNILIEIWQFVNPPTPNVNVDASLEKLGYTHICFEVEDVMAQYERLSQLGVPFLSEPHQSSHSIIVFGRDPDGNLFELLQFLDDDAPLSLDRLDFGN